MPERYRFVHDSLDCNRKLIYGDNVMLSAEGSQLGNPLNGLEFCEFVQPILLEREARITMGLIDDIDLEGEISLLLETSRPLSTLTRRQFYS